MRGRVAAAAALAAAVACGNGGERGGERVIIAARYPGVSTADVEQALVERLEQGAGRIPGVVGLRGVARSSDARVEVTFKQGIDALAAAGELREAVAAMMPSLPANIEPPVVMRAPPTAWVYATLPEHPERARTVRHKIRQIAGVLRVDVCGERRAVVALELSAPQLTARGFTAADVASVISAQNLDIPGGRVEVGPGTATVRITGGELSFDAVSTLPLGRDGVRVSDVAAITNRSQTDCVAVGAPGDVLLRAGLHVERDRKAVVKAMRAAGAVVVDGPVVLRDVEMAGAVHERAEAARARLAGRKGWYAVVPRDAAGYQLVMTGVAEAKLGAVAQAVLRGPELEPLATAAAAARDALAKNADVELYGVRGAGHRPELRLDIDRQRAADLGVPMSELARTLELAAGERVGRYHQGGEELDVVVSVDGGLAHWADLTVRTESGSLVRLESVVRVEERNEPFEILHLDRERAVVVWAQGKPGVPAARVRQALTAALPGATIGAPDPRNLADDSW